MTDPDLVVRSLTAEDHEALSLCVTREAVVPVLSAADLGRRLSSDRRILMVESAEGQTLAFVHVALTLHFPTSLDVVLHGPAESEAPRCASFYGITRIDEQVRGQGGALLRAAKRHIGQTVPEIRAFATLSPMPGFRAWVEGLLGLLGHPDAAAEIDAIARKTGAGLTPEAQRAALGKLANFYLLAKDDRGRVKDPVARFHLGEGAQLRAILVGADTSWHGLGQSLGVMASYQYDPLPVPPPDFPSTEAPLDVLLPHRSAP